MEIRLVQPGSQEAEDFIALVDQLYPANQRRPRAKEIQQLINQSHVLSPQFSFQAYVLYQDKQALMRASLILYPNQRQAYLGYFEGVNHPQTMTFLVDYLAKAALTAGYDQLVGPIDGSFWLAYRMKLDQFQRPAFTGEPHNLAYYPQLWRQAGFELVETYVSNYYPSPDSNFEPNKLKQRFQYFQHKGIKFRPPTADTWSADLAKMYSLLTELYQDFPFFVPIDQESFCQLFDPLQKVLNFKWVNLAFDQDRLIGFMIALPNYGSLLDQDLNLFRIVKLLQKKYRPKEVIMLYLGVDPAYLGLGSALVYPLVQHFRKNKIRAIGALIKQGKVSQNYLGGMIDGQTHYGLFAKKLVANGNDN